MSSVMERVEQRTTNVDVVLRHLLAYDEIFGAVAVNSEGLVMGSAGMIETDVDVVSLLGASLTGVAERASLRLGTGSAVGLTLVTTEGMITIRNGGAFAVMVFSTHCDSCAVLDALTETMTQIGQLFGPA